MGEEVDVHEGDGEPGCSYYERGEEVRGTSCRSNQRRIVCRQGGSAGEEVGAIPLITSPLMMKRDHNCGAI